MLLKKLDIYEISINTKVQRRFALVSNLDKTYQQLAKNVQPRSEQIFGVDLPKRI